MQKLLEKINQQLDKATYFYLTRDIERALGLEDLISSYHVAVINNSPILELVRKNNVSVFSLAEHTTNLPASSYRLLKSDSFQNYLQTINSDTRYLQTFKVSGAFQRFAEQQKFRVMNTSSALNRLFEDKVSQSKQLLASGVKVPNQEVVVLGSSSFNDMKSKYGDLFVLQFNRGHSGNATYFIDSEALWSELAGKYPQREARISQFISGPTYTLNGVITKHGVYLGGLSLQITGIKELSLEKGATVGNDFLCREGFKETTLTEIIAQAERIGNYMHSLGYLGMFGIDLIISNGSPYIVEINARQPASIPYYTKIQRNLQQTPLALMHIAAFLDLEIEEDAEVYNQVSMQPIEYSQVSIRAFEDTQVNTQFKSGIFRLQSDNSAKSVATGEVIADTIFLDEDQDKPLILQKETYNASDLNTESGILLLMPSAMQKISKGAEIIRLQAKQSVLLDATTVKPWVSDILVSIKNQL